jgi:Mg2+-importing ATPase
VVAADAVMSKRKNVLFQGTSVVSGSAKAIAVYTGADTVFGKISKEIEGPSSETAFEKGIRSFGYLLMQITIVLAIIILGVNIYFGRPLLDSVLFALALTVGMAPELLPAIMTVAMSAGAKRMAEKKVIVKKLSAIQNLGEVNILCSDKTGTLTAGVIKVDRIVDVKGNESSKIKQFAFLNASFESGFSNPIDDALRSMKDVNKDGYTKFAEVPYDFIRKRLSIAVTKGSQRIMITKGALKNILDACDRAETRENNVVPVDSVRADIQKLYEQYSSEGFRTIGICYKEIDDNAACNKDLETGMIFGGFVLLYDPPKEGIIEVIQQLKNRGVSLKMITGDNKLVAAYIGKKIGFENVNVISGGDLQKMNPEEMAQQVSSADVFAEIEPHQKEEIIRALQKAGNAVAYIGDGINDVTAIHAADAGISVDNAVDVAKEAADIVLLEKDLRVLEQGIAEGRRTFVNTLKYIFINTSATFGNMFSMAGASLILPFLPMLPKQILLTNFLTDFPYMFVAADNVDEERLMKPQKWNNKFIRNFMFVFGLQSSLFDYFTFYVLYKVFNSTPDHFRTGWFVESILTELLILFIVRTRHAFYKSTPGKMLFISSIICFIITVALPYSPLAGPLGLDPLPYKIILSIIGITAAYALTAEWLKIYFFRKSEG